MEILILHPGALGDIILALPAISLLRKAYPSARLTLAGNIDHLEAILTGRVENVLSLSALPLHRLFTAEILTEEATRFWKSYQYIVSWTGSTDIHFCRNMKTLHPRARIASWKPGPEDSRHVSQIFADSLEIGIPGGKLSPPRIDLDAVALGQGRQWLLQHGWDGLAPLTAIHPGAGAKGKRWPLQRYIELARWLTEEKRRLMIVEGPAEQGTARQISKAVPDSNIILCEGSDLRLLSGILAQCRIFIGNDSGITHLAAALGISCLAVFGPTLPRNWAPQADRVIVLRNTRGCKGCKAGESGHTCLENISVDSVIQNFQRLSAITV